MSSLSAAYLHDEDAAHEFVESVLWPQGPHCPHCGSFDRITKVKANPEKRIRVGLWRCGACKRQFTVKVGTIFEDSKIGAAPVGPGYRADDGQQEGHKRPPAAPHAGSNLQDRVVHGASYP